MAILEKFVAKKVPKIREYNLGIAMIIGMLFAIIYDMAGVMYRKGDLKLWKIKN